MSNTGRLIDRTPYLTNAGLSTTIEGLSADNSIRQELYIKHHLTPEKIKKYRKSEKEIVGKKQIHYGIYDDPKDFETFIHGAKTKHSEHVNDCIKGDNLSGINHFINQIKEQKYASSRREPLGQGIQRNYVFPNKTKDEEFRFGVPTVGCKFLNKHYKRL